MAGEVSQPTELTKYFSVNKRVSGRKGAGQMKKHTELRKFPNATNCNALYLDGNVLFWYLPDGQLLNSRRLTGWFA